MKILVAGGRRYFDTLVVNRTLNALLREFGAFTLIHGGATGADNIAKHWAVAKEIKQIEVRAEWWLYGHKAGFLRNQKMIEMNPDLVILFPGGKGTALTRSLAEKAGIEIRIVDESVDFVIIKQSKK